jgi:hypothetical protein
MDFFNTLLLLSELGSKIGNVDFDDKFRFDIKTFKKLNNFSFVNDIPKFDDTKKYITVNGQKAPVGTILKRPLDNFFQRATQLNVEYHYAIVLGTSNDGRELLIEMTKSRNVNIITKKEFLVDKFPESVVDFYFTPKNEYSRDYIFDRARKFEFESYDLLDLNCKVFAEFVIWDIPTPKRKVEVKKFQTQLCDLKIAIYKLQLLSPDNQPYFDFIKKQIEEAEVDKARLTKAINEQATEKINETTDDEK